MAGPESPALSSGLTHDGEFERLWYGMDWGFDLTVAGRLRRYCLELEPFSASVQDGACAFVVPRLSRSNRSRRMMALSTSSRSERSSEMNFDTSMSSRWPQGRSVQDLY